jgi:outer membrane protein assembly factor BamA
MIRCHRFAPAAIVALIALCAAAPTRGEEAPSDSTFAEKRSAREPWERVVSFPSDVVDLALDIPFNIVKVTAAFVYERHVVEKVVDFLTADDGSRGVVPVFEPRGGGGAKYFHRNLGVEGSKLTLHAQVGRYHRQSYGAEMKRLALFGGPLTSGFALGYDFDSDEEFFGLGPGTNPGNESNYAHERAYGELRLGMVLGEKRSVYLGGVFGAEHVNILRGRGDDTPNTLELSEWGSLSGVGDHVRLGWLGARIAVDTRDFEGSPTRGWLATARGNWYRELDDDRFGFWKLNSDVTRHVEIAYRRVLDLRVAGEFTLRQSDRAVPFYHLSSIGRYETIRGVSKGRFRDANAVLASVQYRWPVGRGTDGVLFVDAGNVYDNIENFRSKHIDVGWGGGLRVYSGSGLIATVEVAKSREEWRFYFVLN